MQFATFHRFKKAISIYSIFAWRVLWAIYQSLENPNEAAETVFSTEEIRALCLIAKRKKYNLTVHEAVVQTAKLGGYLARKGDGQPGIKTLWIGFQTLTNIVYGIAMERKALNILE